MPLKQVWSCPHSTVLRLEQFKRAFNHRRIDDLSKPRLEARSLTTHCGIPLVSIHHCCCVLWPMEVNRHTRRLTPDARLSLPLCPMFDV
jgi:hypothetical protein